MEVPTCSSRQNRKAYEGFSPTVDPNEWLAEGKKPLVEGSFLYGTTDVTVTRLDERTFEAQGILYTPYPYDEEEVKAEDRPDGAYLYTLTQTFTLEVGKRGWYEITSISSPRIDRIGFLEVEIIPRFEQTLHRSMIESTSSAPNHSAAAKLLKTSSAASCTASYCARSGEERIERNIRRFRKVQNS